MKAYKSRKKIAIIEDDRGLNHGIVLAFRNEDYEFEQYYSLSEAKQARIDTRLDLIILDIKDCFFSIPLHPQDAVRFAFTVPSINHVEPDERFEWVVLPQGMTNN